MYVNKSLYYQVILPLLNGWLDLSTRQIQRIRQASSLICNVRQDTPKIMRYRNIDFFHEPKHKIASSEDLDYFTRISGYTLPKDYQDFLRTVNGGKPWWSRNQVYLNCPERSEIYLFYPYIRFKLYTAQPGIWKVQALRRPRFIFEIAVLTDNRSIVIDLEQERYGHVYVVSIDPGGKSPITKDSSISQLLSNRRASVVADSFSGFIDKLEVAIKTKIAEQGGSCDAEEAV